MSARHRGPEPFDQTEGGSLERPSEQRLRSREESNCCSRPWKGGIYVIPAERSQRRANEGRAGSRERFSRYVCEAGHEHRRSNRHRPDEACGVWQGLPPGTRTLTRIGCGVVARWRPPCLRVVRVESLKDKPLPTRPLRDARKRCIWTFHVKQRSGPVPSPRGSKRKTCRPGVAGTANVCPAGVMARGAADG